MARRLAPEETALWKKVAATVEPIAKRPLPLEPKAPPTVKPPKSTPRSSAVAAVPRAPAPLPPPRRTWAGSTLDGHWDRRLRKGLVRPDMSIDLHGHSLSAAHVRLNQAIASGLARDARVLLVVTGKPPKNAADGASRRGVIRAEIGHWLETSPNADRIASVRVAHPRHGGDGALYLVLRRKK